MEKTLEDYIKYLNIDLTRQSEALNDVIEDTAVRLDEFNGIANMVCSEGVTPACSKIPEINKTKTAVDNLCSRIDTLGALINRIHSNMDKVEEALDVAEGDLMGTDHSIKNIFKPLFFKKSLSEGESSKIKTPQEPINIFSASDYFENDDYKATSQNIVQDSNV